MKSFISLVLMFVVLTVSTHFITKRVMRKYKLTEIRPAAKASRVNKSSKSSKKEFSMDSGKCFWSKKSIVFDLVTPNSSCFDNLFYFELDYTCEEGITNGCDPIYYNWNIYRVQCNCNFVYLTGNTCTESELDAQCGAHPDTDVVCIPKSWWLVCGNYYLIDISLYPSLADCNAHSNSIGYQSAIVYWSCFTGWSIATEADACWCR